MGARAAAILRRLESAPLDRTLLGISLLAAVPRLYLGATQYIEYDGYWHVFIAMQDDWRQFFSEYQANYHPPLFYLLLKVALWFGRTPLVYRAISLLTGIASVFITGKIAEKVSLRPSTAAVAVLAYGLALPSIIISCEVRAYMLSVLLVLLSFYYFLDLLEPSGRASGKSRMLFALMARLAGYSHYGAFFYLFACAVVALLSDLFPLRRSLWKRVALDVTTFGPIAAAIAYVYFAHAGSRAIVTEHLRSYYFDAGGSESVPAFLFRNGQERFNRFSPLAIGTSAEFRIALAMLLLCAAWLIYLIRGLRRPENAMAAATVLTGVVMLASLIVGSIMDKYPFGGELRHQFFLFPFAILSGCILLDRLASAICRPVVAAVLVISASAATVAVWAFAFAQYPKNRTGLGTAQMTRFRQEFPAPAAVYADQFNLNNFFTHYHNWNWHFVGQNSAVPAVDIYQVSRGTTSLLLCRNQSRWNASVGDRAWYAELAKCIRSLGLPSLTIFYTRQQGPGVTIQQESVVANQMIELAQAASLCITRLSIWTQRFMRTFERASARPKSTP